MTGQQDRQHAPPIIGVRLRPPAGPNASSCWDVDGNTLKTAYSQRGISLRHADASYQVDCVFDGKQAVGAQNGAQNEDVFQRLVVPLLEAAATEGTGGCCLAYGQTGVYSGISSVLSTSVTFVLWLVSHASPCMHAQDCFLRHTL